MSGRKKLFMNLDKKVNSYVSFGNDNKVMIKETSLFRQTTMAIN